MKQSVVVGGILFFLVANMYAPGGGLLPVANHPRWGRVVLLGYRDGAWADFGHTKQDPIEDVGDFVLRRSCSMLMASFEHEGSVYSTQEIEHAVSRAQRLGGKAFSGDDYTTFLALFRGFVSVEKYNALRRRLSGIVGENFRGDTVSQRHFSVEDFAWVRVRDLCATLVAADPGKDCSVRRIDSPKGTRTPFIPLDRKTCRHLRNHITALRALRESAFEIL